MKIAQLRKIKGLTQAELAAACGTTQQQIAKIENFTVDPQLSTLRRVAEALGQEVGDLFISRAEFLKIAAAVLKENHSGRGRITPLELNNLCTHAKKLPPFHPFWEQVEIVNGGVRFKERIK